MSDPIIAQSSNVSMWTAIRREQNQRLLERRDNEVAELKLIDERDAAEEAFIHAFIMVVGHPPPFSSAYCYREALQDLEECLMPKSLRMVK